MSIEIEQKIITDVATYFKVFNHLPNFKPCYGEIIHPVYGRAHGHIENVPVYLELPKQDGTN